MSKKLYESYLIIDGNLDDSVVEEVVTKYENLLKKNDAEIVNVARIGRRRLAYPLKKRVNGSYVCYEILSSPTIISKLERAYKLDENILRYLTIFVSPKTKKEKEDHFKHKAALLKSKSEEIKASTESAESPSEGSVNVPAVEGSAVTSVESGNT